MSSGEFTFSKEERLCGKKSFESVLKTGSSFFVFPFRVVFLIKPAQKNIQSPASLGTSVPKRKFKRAVDRNRIKRLIKEAYRLHKLDVFYPSLESKNLECSLLLIYSHTLVLDLASIEKKMTLILAKLSHDHIQAL